MPHVHAAGEEARHRYSSKRITVEHALADHHRLKQLFRAIPGLDSDRTADA
ncbi:MULTISPECIES: hypothetical protein [unclassified Streptomyces]|uniref:hypothetical protein n=1 Tax=unclassified Streptomyces TaxID=2593676 RepID=UPI000A5CA9E7|nr:MULTISPECIES: hypothetical protein [unclassified Streptomyces]